jgi:protein phosphatase
MLKLWKRKSSSVERVPADGKESTRPTRGADWDLNSNDLVKWRVAVSLQTDVGCCRDVNEDSGRFVDPADDEVLRRRGRIAIVADGMGGHSAGEVASSLAVDVISRSYYEGSDDAVAALRRSFAEANKSIHDTAQQDGRLSGMGTTCTALVLRNGTALAAHVGDSRLYLVRNGQVYLMTEDHSAVMEMVKQGLLSLEEARHHPDKNVILRALGSQSKVDVTIWQEPFPVKEGDRFLLCTDGLYDLVEDREILEIVSSDSAHRVCERLIALAKERGGYDNITVAFVGIAPLDEAQVPSARETREFASSNDPS